MTANRPTATETLVARVDVPPEPRGKVVFYLCFGGFVAAFVGIAIYNLRHGAALTVLEIGGSTVWLLIVALMIATELSDCGGPRGFFTASLGAFSRRRFLDVLRDEQHAVRIEYGFDQLGRRFRYFTAEGERLDRVNWRWGQASDRAKRDLGDWSVVVWLHPPAGPPARRRRDVLRETVHVIGPEASKERTAALGAAIVEALRSAGLRLVPGDDECEFVVDRAPDDGGPDGAPAR